jgi:hypothetical protein
MKKFFFLALYFASSMCLQAQTKTPFVTDGPYILYEDAGLRFIQTDTFGTLLDTIYKTPKQPFVFDVESNKDNHRFSVQLHPFKRPNWKAPEPQKIFVTSDPHGDINSFVSILKGGGVIDHDYRWTFGKNRLVVIGDVFDRGVDVLPVYWLIYKLQQEAEIAGGAVDFLLGNHEAMVLSGDYRYVQSKYRRLSDSLNLKYNELFGINSELGRWLRTRNTMQIIGSNLFVHAGISPELVAQHWTIPAANDSVSFYITYNKKEREASAAATFLFGNDGPLWYRGMVRTDKRYKPCTVADVDAALREYGVSRIYVGHTIFDDISAFFGGKVIGVNVENAENLREERARAILIEDSGVYWVYDSGEKTERL